MRYSFLFFFLFFITALHAQKFEMGINGGAVYNTLHNTVRNTKPYATINDFTYYKSSVITPVVSIKAMIATKRYLFGADAGYRNIKYKAFVHADAPTYMPVQYSLPMYYGNRDISLKIFVCRKVCFKRLETYGGVYGAYIANRTGGSNGDDVPEVWHNNRFGAGVLAGGTYYITKTIGLNAEVSGEWNNYYAGFLDESDPLDKNIVSIPVTLGLRFRM